MPCMSWACRGRARATEHVAGAEVECLWRLGLPRRELVPGDEVAIERLRAEIVVALGSVASDQAGMAWSPRHGARQLSRHVLDRAFGTEHRSFR